VVDIVERKRQGEMDQYYSIELLSHPDTNLMVPSSSAEKIGLRRAISRTDLKKMWRVLVSDPKRLPDEHRQRYAVLREKLSTGDAFQVAEVVRDMAWRQQEKGHLTTVGKQMYEEGMVLLAGEVAAVRGVEFVDAERQVRAKLVESRSSVQ
jgi:CarD family transcriptional regulator